MFFLGLIVGFVLGVGACLLAVKKFFGAFKLNW